MTYNVFSGTLDPTHFTSRRKKSPCHRQQNKLRGKVVTQKLQSLLGKVMQFNWPFVRLLDGLFQIDPDLLSALSDEPKPLDFFSFFLHDELIAILVHETNCYAEQYIANASLGPE